MFAALLSLDVLVAQRLLVCHEEKINLSCFFARHMENIMIVVQEGCRLITLMTFQLPILGHEQI